MESTIVKIFCNHDPNRFPNDTDGAAGRCSAHGEAGACGGVGNHDVLLEEKDGTPVRWAICTQWTRTHPDAIEHLRRHGFAN
jgi:hypothetical protein